QGIQKGRMEGLQEGLQEGLRALQRSLVTVVRVRYPDLAELAQQQAKHIDNPGALELLIQQVVTAPDAGTARWLLESGTGKSAQAAQQVKRNTQRLYENLATLTTGYRSEPEREAQEP